VPIQADRDTLLENHQCVGPCQMETFVDGGVQFEFEVREEGGQLRSAVDPRARGKLTPIREADPGLYPPAGHQVERAVLVSQSFHRPRRRLDHSTRPAKAKPRCLPARARMARERQPTPAPSRRKRRDRPRPHNLTAEFAQVNRRAVEANLRLTRWIM
jgi:hypothetical protein